MIQSVGHVHHTIIHVIAVLMQFAYISYRLGWSNLLSIGDSIQRLVAAVRCTQSKIPSIWAPHSNRMANNIIKQHGIISVFWFLQSSSLFSMHELNDEYPSTPMAAGTRQEHTPLSPVGGTASRTESVTKTVTKSQPFRIQTHQPYHWAIHFEMAHPFSNWIVCVHWNDTFHYQFLVHGYCMVIEVSVRRLTKWPSFHKRLGTVSGAQYCVSVGWLHLICIIVQ